MSRVLGCLGLVLLAGCFHPNPPAGAYRCSAADQACPEGMRCTCNLCVRHDEEAVCKLQVIADLPSSGMVDEHQAFALHVTALGPTGQRATGFGGVVGLSSSWGDINPPTVQLSGGQAVLSVSLNRETLPPQTAKITASFAGNEGQSGKIGVSVPPFTRDPNPVVAPPATGAGFGFADVVVGEPDVLLTGPNQYTMYFVGYSDAMSELAFGVANSSDGLHFTAQTTPVLRPLGVAPQMHSPSVFRKGTGGRDWLMAFSQGTKALDSQDIHLAGPSEGNIPFPRIGPLLKQTDCAYCDSGVQFPSVIADPAGGQLMFFSAIHDTGLLRVASIGRASSTDGMTFVPEPAPLLSGDLTGEALLFAPRVLVDGTVYKMWYSFARVSQIRDISNPCDTMSKVQIGYATSSDGFYWIRSPSNPVVPLGGGGWDADVTAMLNGAVLPLDGSQPASGVALYYTTFRFTNIKGVPTCVPNGIGRATRS